MPAWKGEDMNQNVMLVPRDNRQKLKKDLRKFQLNYLNLMQILGLEIFLKTEIYFFFKLCKKLKFDKMWKLTYI